MNFRFAKIIPKLNSQNDPRVQRVVRVVTDVCAFCGIEIREDEKADKHTLLIAVGGDGTMLEAIKQSADNGGIALGINLGRVGFLTDLATDDLDLQPLVRSLVGIFRGTSPTFVEKRALLVGGTQQYTDIAGNEISVSQRSADSMISYRLTIGDMNAGIHRANTIMVASATGSTAYSLSAGGALMMPDMQSMQIVPVAPLTLTSRPIVVPSRMSVKIEAWGGQVSVRFDGQLGDTHDLDRVFTKEHPFTIEIGTNIFAAHILHLEGWNYFDILTQKLGWIKE